MKFFSGCDLDVRENCPAFLATCSDTMKFCAGRAGNGEAALPLFLLYLPVSDLQDKNLKSSGKRTGWFKVSKKQSMEDSAE